MQGKKTTSRITSLRGLCLLCLCTVFCLLAGLSVEAAETLTSGNWEYVILADGIVEITAYKGAETEVVVPGEIDGKNVVSIRSGAFSDCSSLSDITIPSSVTSIGNSVFEGCSSDLTIYGEPGSYAEEYAKENGMEFKCSHTLMQVITKATAKKNGAIVNKCSACGDIESTIEINAASGIKLSKTSFTYNGKNKKPTVIIKDSKGNKLSADSYKITRPKTSKKVGKYTVTITLQGNYSGTVKLTYQIIPKGTSISELNAKKKGFTADWKKQMGQTTGYQLQYSTNKKFKGAKTVTIKNNKTVSKSIEKLKADEKYYVRIRTYKTVKVNGKSVKLCSDWSKVETTIPTVGKVYQVSVKSLYQTGNRGIIRYGGDRTTTVASSGCGGVSLAMALNALKNQKTYTGKKVMQWMADNGYYYGYGTMQSGLYAYAVNQGLKAKYADTSSELISELKKGAVAIAIVKDKTGHQYFANATSSGHYILISGFKVQRGVNQVYVNNPMSTKTSGWFNLNKLERNVKIETEGYANSYVIISK